jgi:hypothetical protein
VNRKFGEMQNWKPLLFKDTDLANFERVLPLRDQIAINCKMGFGLGANSVRKVNISRTAGRRNAADDDRLLHVC